MMYRFLAHGRIRSALYTDEGNYNKNIVFL